jgi:RHS repeat-associated protein
VPYGYDGSGTLVWGTNGAGGKSFHIYAGDLLLGEIASSNTVTAAYTWGANGLVALRRVSQSKSLWYHFGPSGETRQLTDSTGTVADTYFYSPYGIKYAGNAPDTNPFRFGGQAGCYTDVYTSVNLILCGARWYNPQIGRWLSRDPIGYGGGENLYAYCDGDPVNGVDADGTDPLGHHFVPSAVRDSPGLSASAREVFERYTTGSFPGHVNDAAHRAYTSAVEDLWQRHLSERNLNPARMTAAQAREFVERVRSSAEPAIGPFARGCQAQADRYFLQGWLAKRMAQRAAAKAARKQLVKQGLKRTAGLLGKHAGPIVMGAFFLYDWYQGGFGHAVNELAWPASLLWGGK